MNYLLIHGLNASKLSFTTISHNLLQYRGSPPAKYLAWEPEDNFEEVLLRGAKLLEGWDNVTVIGHSLGGLLAWHLANKCLQVTDLITVTTPYDGFSLSAWKLPLMFMPKFIPSMLEAIDKKSWVIKQPKKEFHRLALLNVVGTKGLFSNVPNDGVLTVKSQKSVKEAATLQTVALSYSHMEILHSPELQKLIYTRRNT